MPTVLTIAGFDPSSGAGITADLAVFAAHGLFGTSCITDLTVQSTLGVAATYPVAPHIVRETLDHLQQDLPPAGIKIGMLGNAACVAAVADYLEGLRSVGQQPVVVLDPVLRSSSGKPLLDDAGVDLLRSRLLPLVHWITPNHDEWQALAGHRLQHRSQEEIAEAVSVHRASLTRTSWSGVNVLLTGGDRTPPNDLLVHLNASGATESHWLTGEHVATTSTHGTGCAFSSALLSRLIVGDAPLAAARAAKDYVTEALRRAQPIGHGRGPFDLLWPLRR